MRSLETISTLIAELFLAVVLLASCTNKAPEFVNPKNTFSPDIEAIHNTEPPSWDKVMASRYENIRVKIFPHNGKYASPQGREKTLNHIEVTSPGSCVLYYAEKDTAEGGISRNKIAGRGNDFSFSTKNFAGPYWLECSRTTALVRDDYSDSPIAYHGNFFIKKVIPQEGAPYLTVVNELSFETYLKGVVPAEMPVNWQMEALKAQAVAARTYALFELGAQVATKDDDLVRENSGAQLDDTVFYQAYLGTLRMGTATNQAVDLTKGEVVLYEGKIIKAFFHADSGGYTEDSENLWGEYYPYIRAKKEIYKDGEVPYSKWSVDSSLLLIQRELQDEGLISSKSVLIGLYIMDKDILPSGRPHWIHAKLDDGSEVAILAADFSYATNLKSSWIRFNEKKGGVVISGRGFGHGAGMSQWGSQIMAGTYAKTYQEILNFYYTGTSIAK